MKLAIGVLIGYCVGYVLGMALIRLYFIVEPIFKKMILRMSSREEIADDYERLRPYLRYRGGRK